DVPTFEFENVLQTDAAHMASFDIPPLFRPRAEKIWTGVLCSRVGNSGEENVRTLCGNERAVEHKQNLYAIYLFDIIFTIAICALGIAVIHKVLAPSQRTQW